MRGIFVTIGPRIHTKFVNRNRSVQYRASKGCAFGFNWDTHAMRILRNFRCPKAAFVSGLALAAALAVLPDIALGQAFGGGDGGAGGVALGDGGDGGHGLNGNGAGATPGTAGAGIGNDGGNGGNRAGYDGGHGGNAIGLYAGGGGGGGGAAGGGANASGTLTGSLSGGRGGYGGDAYAGGGGLGDGGGGGGGGTGYAVDNVSTITYGYGPYTLQGGAGGHGGAGTFYGGVGGDGGSGVWFSTAGSALINGNLLSGGNDISGGQGGAGGNAEFEGGGNGGNGGIGVRFDHAGTVTSYGGTIRGGNGGAAGSAEFSAGTGGAGGAGVSFGGLGIVTNYGTILGGDGGAGGAGIDGTGGAGGAGVVFGAGGTLTNYGVITGGAGGTGASNGAGGAGVTGASLNIVQGALGTITGGLNGAGLIRAYAIDFTSGANTLSFLRTTDGLTGGINIGEAGSLLLDQTIPGAGNVTISNVISGAGGSVVVNAGANVVTLTGVNSYTGATTVSSGILQVGDLVGGVPTGSIMSEVTVGNGTTNFGALRGVGSAITGNVTVNAGSALWPGVTGETSGNTLTVTGNVTTTGTSALFPAYFVSTGFVSPMGVATNDVLTLTGALAPTYTQVLLGGVFLPGKVSTLINYGTREGDFITAAMFDQTTLMRFVTANILYSNAGGGAGTVYVIPAMNLAPAARTNNQAATATGIDTAANLGITTIYTAANLGATPINNPANLGTYGADGAVLLSRLIAFNNAASAPAALDALSGEGITGHQQTSLNAGNLFATAMMDQATIWSGSQEAVYIGMKDGGLKDRGYEAAPRTAARLWATGFGQQASLSGDSTVGGASLSSRASGFAAGMDYEATRNFLLGFAGGYTYSNFSVSDRATSGTVEGAHAGVYSVVRAGGLYLAGAGEYAHYDDKTSRTIAYAPYALGAFDELAKGKFSSGEWLGRFEAGYKYQAGWNFTPFGGFQAASLNGGAFSETSTLAAGGAPGWPGFR